MERERVNSSNIAAIGHSAERSVLEVEFLSGSIYEYYDVPECIYHDLMNADSKGKYLNEFVKKAGYAYLKIR